VRRHSPKSQCIEADRLGTRTRPVTVLRIITLVVLGFAVVVLSGVIDSGRGWGAYSRDFLEQFLP
jgi:hypothetical protein